MAITPKKQDRRSSLVKLTKLALAGVTSVFFASQAHAQSFTSTGVAADTIDASIACGTANLTKTINVTGVSAITDLDFGFRGSHTWRGDIQLDLTSPAPNSVTSRLLVADTTGTGSEDDYNVELDDEAPETINTGLNDVNHDPLVPPFQFEASPNNSLSAFETDTTPNGIWTITICDAEPGFDDGLFLEGTLNFALATGADLSLTSAFLDPSPVIGSTVPVTFEISNLGPEAAGAVTAGISLPSGLTYVNQSGIGSFDDTTGVWTIPSTISNLGTASITLDLYVEPVGPYATAAEILSSDKADLDSTPNNNSTTEDDDISFTLTPIPPATAPDLSCPIADQFTHIWTAPGTPNGWSAGDETDSYVAGGQSLNFSMGGSTTSFMPFGGTDTPVTNQVLTGGATAAHGLFMLVDFPSNGSSIVTTLNVGTPGIGVGSLQFSIYDVDFGSAAFVDLINVTGFLNEVPTNAILTPGAANSVSGTSITGTGTSDLTSAAGNMTATFLSPVDQVIITYGNGPGAPANPLQQGITIAPITMCPPIAADLNATKTVEVYDPGALGLYMTPGNEVLYKIIVTNSATATADAEDVDISDTLPTNLKFVSATTTGFTGGAFGSPALPATNQDCAVTACVIRYSGGDVPINTTAEIQVRAMIK